MNRLVELLSTSYFLFGKSSFSISYLLFLKNWLLVSDTSYIYSEQLLSFAMKALDGLINTRAEEITSIWGRQKTLKKQEKVWRLKILHILILFFSLFLSSMTFESNGT